MEKTEKKKRGFAAMSPEQRRKIASKGGRAAHAKGSAHTWNSEEASEAGRKGGKAAQESGNGNQFNSTTGAAAAKRRKR